MVFRPKEIKPNDGPIFLDIILIIFEYYMNIILAGKDLNVLSPAMPLVNLIQNQGRN